MEKEEMILTITNEMANSLTNYQLELLKNILIIHFKNIEITVLTDDLKKKEERNTNETYINTFLSAKEIEGCSKRTIKYYKENIEHLIFNLDKPIKKITTEDFYKVIKVLFYNPLSRLPATAPLAKGRLF